MGACMEGCCPVCGKQLANLTSQRQHLHLRSCKSRHAAVWQVVASPQRNSEQQLPCTSDALLPLKRKALSSQVTWLTPIRTASQQNSQPAAACQPQEQLERKLLSISAAGRPACSCSSSTASAEAEPAVEPAACPAGAADAAPHSTEQQRGELAASAHWNAAAHAGPATTNPSPSMHQTSPQKEGLPDARHNPEADASGSSMAACLQRLGLSSYWPAFKQVSPDSSAT